MGFELVGGKLIMDCYEEILDLYLCMICGVDGVWIVRKLLRNVLILMWLIMVLVEVYI